MMGPVKSGFVGAAVGAVAVTIVFIILYFVGCGQSKAVAMKMTVINLPKVEYKGKPGSTLDPRLFGELRMGALQRGFEIDFWAYDDYKRGSMTVKIDPIFPWKQNIISLDAILLAGYNSSLKHSDVLYGANLNYTRMTAPWFGAGAGVTYIHSAFSPDWYAGVHARLSVAFSDLKL